MITVHSLHKYSDDGTHLSRVAWEESRSKNDPASLTDILKIDAPVSEIPSAVFTIQCTILEREIFTSARDHHAWARTSRVDSPTGWLVPPCLIDSGIVSDEAVVDLKQLIQQDLDNGVAQDLARLNIPVCALTAFTTSMDIRSIAKMVLYFRKLSKEVPVLAGPLTQTADSLYSEVLVPMVESEDNAKLILSTYLTPDYLPDFDYDDGVTSRIGNFLVVTTRTTLSLRTQAIRHRTFQIADSFLKLIKTVDNPWMIKIGQEVDIQISAPVDIWMKTVAKRQCWIAHHGLWKPVIDAASPYLPISEDDLPCKESGACPYVRDAELRFTDKDPGSPCPKFVQFYNKDLTPELFKDMRAEAFVKPSFWESLVVQCVTNVRE